MGKESDAIANVEGLFGRIAVQLGFVSESQLTDCLAEQELAKKEGQELRLGQVLLRRRLLTTTQFLRIMSEQESRVGHSDQRQTIVHAEIQESSAANPAVPLPALMPGKVLGRYEILRQIGRGGMGVVYEARDTVLKRRVALKVLREDMVDPKMGQRLEKEAVTAARLKHPNIVTLYETGVADETRYLSMEYIEGKSLRDLVGRPEIDLRRKLELMEPIARAVDYAHSRGVIHRDLKPGNVMIDTEGRPLVMDFGLARLLDDFTQMQSRTGTLVGTPGYMAPEQITGTAADIGPKTDLYALGVMMYEMLSGRLPYDGRSPSEICNKIIGGEPDPIPGVPYELECVVRKAMHRDRNERYVSAGELADEIRRFREDEPVRAAPPSVRRVVARAFRHHRALAASVLVAFVCLAGVASFFAVQRARRDAEIRRSLQQAREAQERGDWQAALAHWAHLDQLGHPGSDQAVRQAARELQQSQERARAGQLRSDAAGAEREHAKALERLAALEKDLADAGKLEPNAPTEKKKRVWDLERECERLRVEILSAEARAIGLHISALRYDPSGASGLFQFLRGLLHRAEEEGDADRARQHEETLRQLAQERGLTAEIERLEAGGTVRIETDPPGAEIDLYLYEEAQDRRRLPRLVKKGWSPSPLARGSYLLIVRRTGCREARVPVRIARETSLEMRLPLYADAQIGSEFVYVPAGEFISGDPSAYLGEPRRMHAKTEAFFIGKHEITFEEYLEFLNAMIVDNPKDCDRWRPKWPHNGFTHDHAKGAPFPMHKDVDPRWPVVGIAWENAAAYAEWRSKRDGCAYRLPTAAEWEKAARGVDGRAFPWGDGFDWSYMSGFYTFEKSGSPQRVGAMDADESPYLCRDMSGNAKEFCEDWFNDQRRFKVMSGGSYGQTDAIHFRVATRANIAPGHSSNWAGFRLVKEIPRK